MENGLERLPSQIGIHHCSNASTRPQSYTMASCAVSSVSSCLQGRSLQTKLCANPSQYFKINEYTPEAIGFCSLGLVVSWKSVSTKLDWT